MTQRDWGLPEGVGRDLDAHERRRAIAEHLQWLTDRNAAGVRDVDNSPLGRWTADHCARLTRAKRRPILCRVA
jgi:hypothetical protein